MVGIKPKEKINKTWRPEFAYALGLLATDGNLSPDGRHISLTSKDIDLLKTFKKCLGIENSIGKNYGGFGNKKTSCNRVQFGDVIFYRWLLELGLTPNKSKTIGTLKIPKKFFFDFLRGCFDGDGSINAYWDPRWKSSYMFYLKFYSGSIHFLQWLQKTIFNLSGVCGNIRFSKNCYDLEFAKTASRTLLRKIYYSDNAPRLERKYVKVKKIFSTDQNPIRHSDSSIAQVAKVVHAQD